MFQSRFQIASPGSLRNPSSLNEGRSSNLEFNDLLSQAYFQKCRGNIAEAIAIYSKVASEAEGPLQQRAQEQLNAVQGNNGFTAARAEFLAETFVDQVMDPAALGAMIGAGLTYRVARFGLLGMATRLGMRSRLVQPTASLLAFGGEASLFPIYVRLGNMALGRGADWSSEQLIHDIQGSFLVLGGLKLSGAAGNRSLQWWMQGGRASGPLARRVLPILVPQTAMYLGILSGHQAEQWFGLRDTTSMGQLLSESLVTLYHFNAMGRLMPLLAGSRIRSFEQDLELESNRLPFNRTGHARSLQSFLGPPDFALVETSSYPSRHPVSRPVADSPKRNHILMMSQHGESNGNGSNNREPANGRRGSRSSTLRPQAQLRSYSSQIERVLGKAMDVFLDMEGSLEPQATRDLETGIIELIERQGYWQREIREISHLPQASQGPQSQRVASGLLELRRKMEDFLHSGSPEVLGESPLVRRGQDFTLRQYQQEMMEALNRDLANEKLPWLGLASPMQTGKSFLIGPIVRRLEQTFGPQTRVIILSSARVITDQIIGDLLAGFPAQDLGRFDAQQKDIRNITLASAHSMIRHLDRFETDPFTVLINDEAFFTQSPSYQRIYQHFGLGEPVRRGRRTRMIPVRGNGRIIGLSGTGGGLEGYHVSGNLHLLSAIERGWVRHMEGERIFLDIQSQSHQETNGERVIWWRPNETNAQALARIYREKINEEYDSSLIFVPTIRHGELLQQAMGNLLGHGHTRLVHSKMKESDVQRNILHFEKNGGALISVKKLSRGFRGTGTAAVFHTYQTSSTELFAQRTGRAWGNSIENSLPELFVLEATWNGQGNFANLARVLGLVDYPRQRIRTRNIVNQGKRKERGNIYEEERSEAIQRGEVMELFAEIPLVENWRLQFRQLLESAGDLASYAEATGLPHNTLAGYALGCLPIRWADMVRMQESLGGEGRAREIWVSAWREVVDEFLHGNRDLADALGRALREWNHSEDSLEAQAQSLDEILSRQFQPMREQELEVSRMAEPTEASILSLRHWEEILTDRITFDEKFSQPIWRLPINKRLSDILWLNGMKGISHLAAKSVGDLRAIAPPRSKTLRQIQEALRAKGLELEMPQAQLLNRNIEDLGFSESEMNFLRASRIKTLLDIVFSESSAISPPLPKVNLGGRSPYRGDVIRERLQALFGPRNFVRPAPPHQFWEQFLSNIPDLDYYSLLGVENLPLRKPFSTILGKKYDWIWRIFCNAPGPDGYYHIPKTLEHAEKALADWQFDLGNPGKYIPYYFVHLENMGFSETQVRHLNRMGIRVFGHLLSHVYAHDEGMNQRYFPGSEALERIYEFLKSENLETRSDGN